MPGSRARTRTAPSALKRLLVIHPGALGDVLLALPALASLRAAFPRAELTLAGAPRILTLFQETPLADRTSSVESLSIHECFSESPLSRETKAQLSAFDGIVSWFGSHDPTYCRQLEGLGTPVVIARAAPPPGVRIHVARWLLKTIDPWGIPSSPAMPSPRLPVPAAAAEEARAWVASHDLPPDRLCLVHPGAGSPTKRWAAEGYAALVRWIEAALGASVVLIEGPADAAPVSAVISWIGAAPPRVARHFPLPLQAALLARAALFVGNDSGLAHLAGAVGTPTVALFGPTDPALWAPLGPRVTVVAASGRGGDPWQGVTLERIQPAILAHWRAGERTTLAEPA